MEEEVSVEELKAAIRKGVINCQINPVFVGSAYKNKGVQELLDAVVDYLPAPGDVPAIKGTNLRPVKRMNVLQIQGSFCSTGIQDHDRPLRW